MLGIDRDFGCVNRNLFCRRSVEYIDGDCPGIFIVENLGMIFLVAKLNQVAMMRTF